MSDRPILDPTPVIIRHVRRAEAGETRTMSVLRATFAAADGDELDALNGPAGWQSGEIQCVLAGDGSFRLRLPNTEGGDGRLHRERFAIATDDNYRIGNEWFEIFREPRGPDTLLFVGTPTKYRLTRAEMEVSGADLTALYSLARASEIDVWRHAPRDVWEHYSRLPVANLIRDFAGWEVGSPDSNGSTGTTADGWSYRNAAKPWTTGLWATATNGVLLSAVSVLGGTGLQSWVERAPTTPITSDAWIVDARCEVRPGRGSTQAKERLEITLPLSGGGTALLDFDFFVHPSENRRAGISGTATVVGLANAAVSPHTMQGRTKRTTPGGFALRIVCRNGWAYGYLEGELVARARLRSDVSGGPTLIRVQATDANVIVRTVVATSLADFGLRGADKGDLRLPGAPAPGGLRARYTNEAASRAAVVAATANATVHRAGTALDPLNPPSDARLDGTIDFAVSATPTWQPPAAQPADKAFSAVWTGAIYLDLSAARTLRLANLRGFARLYVGKTTIGTHLLSSTAIGATQTFTTVDLRTHLGAVSGWYPIRLEYVSDDTFGAGLALHEAGADNVYAVVPTHRLSPLGCFEDEVRHESHREIFERLAEAFGYQWRVDYRTFESGEFPGQIIPKVRAGVDTDKIVDTDQATDLAVELDAADAVDMLLADAAGIADPKGAEQLTAEAMNLATLGGGMFIATGYESFAESTEEVAFAQRTESVLALRAGPNEVVAARPDSVGDELIDTFPLTGVLGRLMWRPGDGVRLALPDLSVIDRSPRQLLMVGRSIWPDGTAPPVVGYRQRPRGVRNFMRRTLRSALTPRRTYQGQSAVVYGGLASANSTAGQDSVSRMPMLERDLVEAWVDVHFLAAGGSATLVVDDVNTGIVVAAMGRYPVTRWARNRNAGQPQMLCTVTGAVGSIEFNLGARIRI